MGRNVIIEYLTKKYGDDYVAYVGNRLVYSAKSAIRDLAQVYGIPASETFKCTKGYNDEATVADNIKRSKEVATYFSKHPDMRDRVDRLVGTISSLGIHAGGVIISDKTRGYSLRKYCALQRTKEEGRVATLWTKDEIAKLGFIKYDLLGLSSASMIHYTRETLGLDPYGDAPEEEEVFRDIVMCLKHRNIFQFESQIGRKAFEDFMPMSITELANASAVIRLIGAEAGRAVYDDYKRAVEERQGGNEEWWKERLRDECVEEKNAEIAEQVLGDSFGVLIFQEQLANLVKYFSNGQKTFTEGNHCRKLLDKHKKKYGTLDECQGDVDAVEKWHAAFMPILEEFFLPWLGKDGRKSPDKETRDFLDCKLRQDGTLPIPRRGPIKWILSSAAYLFNKLHAIAYSINSYNMMWLKHNYPLQFWTACLTCEKADLDKVRNFITAMHVECSEIPILGPDVNASHSDFEIEGNGIRFGLGGVQGIGGAASAIIREREANGEYKSVTDMVTRLDNWKSVTKRTYTALLYANALACFGDQPKVWNEFIKVGRDIEEPGTDAKSMAVREAAVIGVNVAFEHPILKQAGFYVPLGDITDGVSDVVAVRVLKTTKKVTKNGKPYALHKVQCLNDGSSTNVFDWLNRELVDEYLIARVQMKNSFMQLLGPSTFGGRSAPGSGASAAKKAMGVK